MPADEIGSDAAAAGQRTRDLWESERQIREIQGKPKNGGIVIMAVLPFG